MKTGQTSWQAPQVVQAHSVSSVVRVPIRGFSASARCASGDSPCWKRSSSTSSGPRSGMRKRRSSRRSWTTCIGDSGLPVLYAGQKLVQRAHSVQAKPSSSDFQVKSFQPWTTPVAAMSSASMFSFGSTPR